MLHDFLQFVSALISFYQANPIALAITIAIVAYVLLVPHNKYKQRSIPTFNPLKKEPFYVAVDEGQKGVTLPWLK